MCETIILIEEFATLKNLRTLCVKRSEKNPTKMIEINIWYVGEKWPIQHTQVHFDRDKYYKTQFSEQDS